jgi:hypothetical protein
VPSPCPSQPPLRNDRTVSSSRVHSIYTRNTCWRHGEPSIVFPSLDQLGPSVPSSPLRRCQLSDLHLWFRTGLGPSSHHVRSLYFAQNHEFKWITPKTLAAIPNNFTPFQNVKFLSLAGIDLGFRRPFTYLLPRSPLGSSDFVERLGVEGTSRRAPAPPLHVSQIGSQT